ncbi:MAG: hypothetical protein LBO66_08730 [Deltaproteobacteria bacterium]|nr:hypothetical protein [Deltaproteobacteria bacterium]
MKKLSALALAAILAAMAIPAFAASPVEFKGYLKVFHESLSNFTKSDNAGFGGRVPGFGLDRDNFFENKFQIAITFRPNDQVSVFWQLRGPNYQRWGNVVDGRAAFNIYTRALYGEAIFPWGTLRAGRIVNGLAGTGNGLTTLGYTPYWGSEFLYAKPFDGPSPVDSLTYTNKWDNGFGLAAYYVKQNSYYGVGAGNYPSNSFAFPTYYFKDNDNDIFGIEGSYEWEGGGGVLGVSYQRDMTNPSVDSSYAIFLNPALVQAWGPFAIHFEGKIGWGSQTISRDFSSIGPTADNKFKSNGLGLYLDGVYSYETGDIAFASFYVSGTGFNGDGTVKRERRDLVSLGDFAPFLVAFNRVTLGNGVFTNNIRPISVLGTADDRFRANTSNNGLDNVWGLSLLGNHAITPEIKLNYGLGFFRLVEPGWQAAAGSDLNGRTVGEKDLGWEIDLGATFKILDNLTFETQFGYMFNGGAFDIPLANGDGWNSAKDSFAWANVLAFTF